MPAKTDPLLTAVLRLTTNHTESQPIPGERRNHYAKHEALLKQLRDAIGGDVNGTGGSGAKPASERTPIDPDAFQKYMTLVTSARDFHLEWVGSAPDVEERPEATLSRAYQHFKQAVDQKTVAPSVVKAVTRQLENICDLILEKLSPPTTREIIGFPCPHCGSARYVVVLNRNASQKDRRKAWIDSEQRVALSVTYRPDKNGGRSESGAHCGCCDYTWRGILGIRELAYELDLYEQRALAMWAEQERITLTGPALEAAWNRDAPAEPHDADHLRRNDFPVPSREMWRQLAQIAISDERAAVEPEPGPDPEQIEPEETPQ